MDMSASGKFVVTGEEADITVTLWDEGSKKWEKTDFFLSLIDLDINPNGTHIAVVDFKNVYYLSTNSNTEIWVDNYERDSMSSVAISPNNQYIAAGTEDGNVYVYDTSVDTQVGDIISVTAEIEEYYSMTELVNVSSYSVISSDNDVSSTLITAEDLGIECSLSGEQYESMLVEIRNVSFDSVDEFGNWTVSDNTGMVMVDDYHFDGPLF